jgi:hypothetical protein
MNTQPTPEADEAGHYRSVAGYEVVLADFARKLERERDEARAYADKLAEGLPDGMLPKDVEVLREANTGLAAEVTTVTAQRDRLAEALRNCMPFITGDGCGEYSDAKAALQSLTNPKNYEYN